VVLAFAMSLAEVMRYFPYLAVFGFALLRRDKVADQVFVSVIGFAVLILYRF